MRGFDFHAKAGKFGAFIGIEGGEDGFQLPGLCFEGEFEGGAAMVGEMDEGLPAVTGVGAAVDVVLFFEALDGGGDGTAGEADAVAQGFDGLGAEAVEDFKEGEISLRGKAAFFDAGLIALAELLVEFPDDEVEVFTGMKGNFSHE